MELRVRYVPNSKGETVQPLRKIAVGDWIDLRASETVGISKGEYKLIPLGVAMKLPEGYEAHLAPRSSTFKKYGIIQANSLGVIDNKYSGTNDVWHFPAIAFEDTIIEKDERICQFRIVKTQPEFNIVEVEKLDDVDRGGFGSTGTK